MNELEKAREIISKTDREMAELFVRRMQAVEVVANYKIEHGLPVLDANREKEVLANGATRVENPELRAYYVNFLEKTMEISRNYQNRLMQGMRVAYCGTEGAFAHIAAGKLFPRAARVAYRDFSAAYRAVEGGECDAAVLPVENSYNGEVGQVTDLMFSGGLYVNAMMELAVSHALLGLPGSKAQDIKEVVSHPQALAQCADFISNHGFAAHEYPNTALAARYVAASGNMALGAIASQEAAEIFGLSVLARNINESRSNTTRFAVFCRAENVYSPPERFSGEKMVEKGNPSSAENNSTATDKHAMGVFSILVFTVRNEAGCLARAVEVIGKYGFNMRTLRSRPMKELLWQYYFYAELEGDVHTQKGNAMLQELGKDCDRLRVVGSYRKND